MNSTYPPSSNRLDEPNARTRPKLSVICAAYNGVTFLPETIRAIQAQTFRDFEVAFVDDASTDGTFELLRAQSDPRFVVARNEANSRQVVTRNRALTMARGEYIAVSDQDDLSHPRRFEKQCGFLDRNVDASAVYSRVRWIDGAGRPIAGAPDWNYGGQRARIALVFHNFVAHSTLMFRREHVPDPIYVPEFPLCEDYWLMVRLADCGKGMFPLRERLVHYRMHDNNYTNAAIGQMSSLSRRLRTVLLGRLGLNPTESELDLHDRFEAGADEPTPALHEGCRQWIWHLRDANARSGYVPQGDFDAVAADKWLELSHKFARLGRIAWDVYCRGPRRKLSPSHYASVASFWAKTRLSRASVPVTERA